MPRTPMQLRTLTKIPGNYANLILKKLEKKEIVKCLTPKEKIGKVFCINPTSRDLVEKVLKHSGYNLKVYPLPELNWKAYGRLNCVTCKQIRKMFHKAVSLRNRGIAITEQNLEKELRDVNGVLEIDRSDIYRALKQLKKLNLVIPIKKKRKPLEYELTKDALALAEFLKSQ
jgi:DNA-binding PadR family transcriptional regulator